LKDVGPYKQNKIGTIISTREEQIFSLVTNDFTDPSTFKEAVKVQEWKENND